ncbi:AMP-binding protein [Sphingobacterium kitahiroshimense]|uniref:AMP-binding protein n=1 Tax=Sphingobacterium kitahiroshimense TaxID=470446 RepID=A0ABV0BQE5_9SPHI
MITDFLIQNSISFPNKVAFRFLSDGEELSSLTYRELMEKVRSLALYLKEIGLAENRVILFYNRDVDFIIAFFACQLASVIATPVPFLRGEKMTLMMERIVSDVKACAILSTSNIINSFLGEYSNRINAHTQLKIVGTDEVPAIAGIGTFKKISKDDTAFIQYTSGSTSNPKGVVISHGNIIHNQKMLTEAFGCDESSIIFSWLPFHHDMGLIGNILHAVFTGCTCIVMSPYEFLQKPQRWLEAISIYGITHSGGPNFAFDLCVDRIPLSDVRNYDLSTWRVAYNGSEPIKAETIKRFSKHFRSAGFCKEHFYPCYGLAEATLLVSGRKRNRYPKILYLPKEHKKNGRVELSNKIDPDAKSVVGCGQVSLGITVKIIAVNTKIHCVELEEGEICIGGESVTMGYWNRQDENLYYHMDGHKYLRTGDLGFIYKGQLFIHGRLKELLIVKGKNYFPYDLELILNALHESLQPNGVSIFNTDESNEKIVVMAEIKRSAINNTDFSEMAEAIQQGVIGHLGMAPFDIVLLYPHAIPRTTSGKIQRIKCRQLYCTKTGLKAIFFSKDNVQGLSISQTSDIYLRKVMQSPTNQNIRDYILDIIKSRFGYDTEKLLQESYELTRIGIDSLRLMELINKVNKDLKINIDISHIVRENTLEVLINLIENLLWIRNEKAFQNGIVI